MSSAAVGTPGQVPTAGPRDGQSFPFPFTLQPGQKQTLEVTARVAGSGPVLVNIGLLTPEGLAFGEPITTQVRSAAYALAAQWVVIAFFAALVLLMIRGALARRTQERAR
jgi:hypothetical protein